MALLNSKLADVDSDEKEMASALMDFDSESPSDGSSSLSSIAAPRDNPIHDLSLFVDVDKEGEILSNLIDVALLDIDYKTGREVMNPHKKWKVHNTKSDNISVVYRKMENDKNLTIRSCMEIECDINDIHEFLRCDLNDDMELTYKVDKMMASYNIEKVYNQDYSVVYSTFNSGAPKAIIKPRDFCFVKKRIKYDNYKAPKIGVKFANQLDASAAEQKEQATDKGTPLVGVLCYSVDANHPNFVQTKKKHVRGWIHYSGFIVLPKTDSICSMYYVISVDPSGKIPKKIVNIAAPQQGMNIKYYVDNIELIKEKLNQRKGF